MASSKIRNRLMIVAAAALTFSMASAASASTILIDHNDNSTSLTGPNGEVWNVISTPAFTTPLSLVDSDGNPTSATISYDGFQDSSTNNSGWNNSTDKDWVNTHAVDYYFATFKGASATATIGGLQAGGIYDVALVSARSSTSDIGTRDADYQVNGSFATDTPNGDDYNAHNDGWVDADILNYNNVTADANGNIVISVAPNDASDYGYLMATRIESVAVPVPATGWLAIVGFAGPVLLTRRRRSRVG